MNSQHFKRSHALGLAIVAIALGAVIASCGDASETAQAEPRETATENVRTVQVETFLVEPTRFEDKIALIGVVESPQDAILSAQSAGTLIQMSDLGQRINRGGVVAQIDAVLIETALAQARANLESARARSTMAEDSFRRKEPLYADSIISALEFEQLQADLNAARAQLSQAEALVAQAEKQYDNTFVRAPFGGRLEEVFVEEGEQVMPGAQIARLVDTEKLKVTAGVPERYAIDIKQGTGVSMEFKAYGVGERTGVISFVGRVIDPQNRSFLVEVELNNQEGSLKPEMVADLFITRSVLDDQLVIPQNALLRDENGISVYVLDRSSGTPTARRQQLALGASFGGMTVVTSGLDAGDEVIVVGQTNVTEGDAVRVAKNAS